MNTRNRVLIGAALLATGLSTIAPADAAPPAYPTGTFTLVGPSTKYLGTYEGFTFTIDSLSPGGHVEAIDTGTPDSTNDPESMSYDIDSDAVHFMYGVTGTFTPRVFVSDAYQQTTIITLPPVTLLQDTTPPTGDIILPAVGVRGTAAAWINLTGHQADPETRVASVLVELMQRRNGIWYVYSSANERWRKGTHSEAGTYKTVHTSDYRAKQSSTAWAQPTTRGLTKGLLVVRVTITNRAGLEKKLPVVRQYLGK